MPPGREGLRSPIKAQGGSLAGLLVLRRPGDAHAGPGWKGLRDVLSLVWERRPFKGKKPVGDGGSVPQAEEERDDMERVKLDNKRILFNLLPAHVAQHFLMSNPRNMVSTCSRLPPHRAAAPRTEGGSQACGWSSHPEGRAPHFSA